MQEEHPMQDESKYALTIWDKRRGYILICYQNFILRDPTYEFSIRYLTKLWMDYNHVLYLINL